MAHPILEAFEGYFNAELRQNFEAHGLDSAMVEMIEAHYGRGANGAVSIDTLRLDFEHLADGTAVDAAVLRLCSSGRLVAAGREQGCMTVFVPELH